jgi:hypothetical protein
MAGRSDAAPTEPTLRRELQRILQQTSINPQPVAWWGTRSHALADLFPGFMVCFTDSEGMTKVRFECSNHSTVADDPDKYAMVADDDGFSSVHACALNGYLDTLRVLVEEGGANPFAQTRHRIDALMLARRRGHASILEYLTDFEGRDGAARLSEIGDRVRERKRRTAEALAKLTKTAVESDESDEGSVVSDPGRPTVTGLQARAAKAAEARAAALAAAMKALEQVPAKAIERLPRTVWRAETVQLDEERGMGYYPRKPFADGDA